MKDKNMAVLGIGTAQALGFYSFSQLSLQPLEGSFTNFKHRLRERNQNRKLNAMNLILK
jgi:hypothetical protein